MANSKLTRIRKPAIKKDSRLITIEGFEPSLVLRRAIIDLAVPSLRSVGFKGSFPKFRRIAKNGTHVLWFALDSGMNGRVQVGLGVVSVRTDTSVPQDYNRAISIHNRHRKLLTELVLPKHSDLFWYEDAVSKWGPSWSKELAGLLQRLLTRQADTWFESRKRK